MGVNNPNGGDGGKFSGAAANLGNVANLILGKSFKPNIAGSPNNVDDIVG